MKNRLLATSLGIILWSCGATAVGSAGKVGGKQLPINNTQWLLDSKVKGKTPTLTIENGKVTGNAGCNNYFGNISLEPSSGTFIVKNVGATKMFCKESFKTEQHFLDMLTQADKYVVTGAKLELYRGNLLLMKFVKK